MSEGPDVSNLPLPPDQTNAEKEVSANGKEDYESNWSERLGDFAITYKWWLFGAVMLLATFLRLWQLDFRSVWYDESFSLTLASRDIPTIINGTANDYPPPPCITYCSVGGCSFLAMEFLQHGFYRFCLG